MSIFLSIACHMAAIYLHGTLVLRLFQRRKIDKFIHFFWLFMILCMALHGVYLCYYISLALHSTNLVKTLFIAGYVLVAFFPPFFIALFIGELTRLPKNPTPITRKLASINTDVSLLFKYGLLISLMTLLPSVYAEFTEGHIQYSFGNLWALAYMIAFATLWLLMLVTGFQSRYKPIEHKNSKAGYIFTVCLMVMCSILSIVVDLGHMWSFIPIVTTVGLAFSFCWSRFRIEFMDVTLRQLFRIIFVIVSVSLLYRFIELSEYDTLKPTIQLLTLTMLAILFIVLYTYLNNRLSTVWQPNELSLQEIHTVLPSTLAQCTDYKSSILATEKILKRIFKAEVTIKQGQNVELDDGVNFHSISLPNFPPMSVQLGLQKGWVPWFSEPLNRVNSAALYLQNHLKALDAIELKNSKEKENQKLITLKAKTELMAMHSQIRPHFLYNTLNSIHSFVTIDPKQAELTIELLSDLLRGTLKIADKDEVPLEEEIRLVKSYLQIEKVRYGEQFTYSENLLPNTLEIKVPAFSIQPLIENAIKHGVDAQLDPVHIVLTCSFECGKLIVEVRDDGPGLNVCCNNELGNLGMATQNIQSRLSLLYGNEASLSLTDGKPGTVSKLSIPIQKQ